MGQMDGLWFNNWILICQKHFYFPAEPTKEIVLPVYLTKGECKKLRRQNRQEAQKEVQEK